MKVSYFDFILSGIAFTFLNLSSWLITMKFMSFSFLVYLSDYSSIISILVYLTSYGVLSGGLIHVLLRIRPIKCGEFSFENSNFTYWKLLTMIHYFGFRSLFLFHIAPMMPLLLRLYGAKVGSNVAIGGILDSPYLITLEDNCVIGYGAIVSANIHTNGKTIIGPVRVGEGSTVGVYSLVMPNTTVGKGAVLAPHSILTLGSQVPEFESWKGHPARKWN